jgi:hypothetical protein
VAAVELASRCSEHGLPVVHPLRANEQHQVVCLGACVRVSDGVTERIVPYEPPAAAA